MDLGGKSIYLAGKIAADSRDGDRDWRFSIVPALEGYWQGDEQTPWLKNRAENAILPHAILGRYHYVGPFFTSMEDTNSGHGGELAYPHAIETIGMLPSYKESAASFVYGVRQFVVERCLAAIAKADLVFAWIDSLTCYGTLFELGYAKALGRTIAVRIAPYLSCGIFPERLLTHTDVIAPHLLRTDAKAFELWFSYVACQGSVATGTPLYELERVLAGLGWEDSQSASPLERLFHEAWHAGGHQGTYPLIPQYPVVNNRYFLDFAHLATRIGIELDGYTYHSDRTAFNRDRQRQRAIEAQGWRLLRFSGDELRANITQCVLEVRASLERASRGQ